MGRLIDADRLKAHYCWWAGGSKEMTIDEAKKTFDTIIDLQPTVDAEPVKHGHNTGEGVRWFRCSECGWGFNDIYMAEENVDLNAFPFYCPNCGAKMDEVEDNEIHGR